MTFLELVNKLRRECSVSGSGLPSVTNQTGESARLVGWIQQAYNEIQALNVDWFFLRKQGTFTTVPGINLITPPTDLNVWDVERFYDDDGNQVVAIEYAKFDRKINPSETGKPDLIIIRNDNRLLLERMPDGAYQYHYDYFRKPFTLTTDLDVPAMPEQFHMAIVARAMILYGNYESAAEIIKQGTEAYTIALKQLEMNQLPNKQQYYGRSEPAFIQVVVG
jgi:hypothetical protein